MDTIKKNGTHWRDKEKALTEGAQGKRWLLVPFLLCLCSVAFLLFVGREKGLIGVRGKVIIEGKVVDQVGNPVAASIWMHKDIEMMGTKIAAKKKVAECNTKGEFRITGVRRGHHTIYVETEKEFNGDVYHLLLHKRSLEVSDADIDLGRITIDEQEGIERLPQEVRASEMIQETGGPDKQKPVTAVSTDGNTTTVTVDRETIKEISKEEAVLTIRPNSNVEDLQDKE